MERDIILLQSRLNTALEDQHTFLEAKSHVKWLKDGDRNTKLFHAAAKVRRSVNCFRVTLADDNVTDDREVVGDMALCFFRDLLGEFSANPKMDYFDDISPSISSSENEALCKIPNEEEIWIAVKNLPMDSVPGPN